MNLFRDWQLIFGLLSREDQRKLFGLLALTAVNAIIQGLGVVSIMPFIAVVANPELVRTNAYLAQAYAYFDFSSISSFLIFLGLGSALILAFGNAVMTFGVWLTVRFCNLREYELQKRLLATYLSQPYRVLLQRNTSELSKNVLYEVERVVVGSLLAYIELFADAVMTVLLICLLMIIDPWVTIATAIVLTLAYAAIFMSIRAKLTALSRAYVSLGTQIFTYVREALEGLKAIKVLGRETFFVERYARPSHQAAKDAVSYYVLEFIPGPLLETVTFTIIILVTVYFAASADHAANIFPTLVMFAFAAYRLVPALKSIFDGVELITYNSSALAPLRNDLELAPVLATAPEQKFAMRDSLVCRGVSFRYSSETTAGIVDIDLEVPAHSSLCLMGPTGGGKSTTVDLLLGLLSPDSGEILVDGTSIHGPNTRRWQRNVGYVPQVIYLTDDTVARNIAFGVPDDLIDDDKVIAAAKLANFHSFITNSLSDGYQSAVGERGVNFSGGQRQRIGIARALYDDPQVLILDEATNELDKRTETEIADTLFALTEKTIIFSTHNQAIAKRCTSVVMLNEGRIIAQGAYSELLKSNQRFRDLVVHEQHDRQPQQS